MPLSTERGFFIMQKKIILLIFFLSFFSIIILSILNLTSTYLPQYDLEVSQITSNRIIAPFTFKIQKSEKEINTEKIKIKKDTEPIYQISTSLTFNAIKNLDYIFSQISKFSSLPASEIKKEMNKLGFDFSDSTINYLLDFDQNANMYQFLSDKINYILTIGIYNENIIYDPIKLVKNGDIKLYNKKRLFSIDEAMSRLKKEASKNNKLVVEEISNYVLNSNIVKDEQATNNLINEKLSEITHFKGQVLKNEEIIGKNKKVTPEIITILNSLKKVYPDMHAERQSNWKGKFIFQFLLLFMLFYSIYYAINNVLNKELNFNVYLLIFFSIFVAFILTLISKYLLNISSIYFPYEFFVLITAIVIAPEIGLLVNLFLMIMISQLIPGIFYEISTHALISLIAILWIKKVFRERHSFHLIGFILLFSSTIVIALSAVSNNFTLKLLTDYLLYIFVSNIITIILLILFTPAIERKLSITTDEKLFNLIDYKNKLLKKLSTQAPGTYYHSLNVGGIAENAAEAIGANPLLARVAGYYHDIGKIENSEIFSENNLEINNAHDVLMPQESASMIKSHINHGVLLAKQYNLPNEIIDIIKQHHGTGVIKFFYQKAKDAGIVIDEEHYRYPGPIPQSKESGLIMISDIVESTIKSKKVLNNSIILGVIDDTINDLIDRKQLVDSGLNFKDIELIKSSLLFTIEGIYGARVEYPNEADNTK